MLQNKRIGLAITHKINNIPVGGNGGDIQRISQGNTAVLYLEYFGYASGNIPR